MIISCPECNKKFEIDSKLIPDNGRLLKCGSCNYEWFFSEEIINKKNLKDNLTNVDQDKKKSSKITSKIQENELPISPNINENNKTEIKISSNNRKKEELDIKPDTIEDDLKLEKSKKIKKLKKKKISFLSLIIILVISMISLILILDTFKKPISKFFPNIEFILYNLYETFKDIKLFFIDLM